MKKLILMIVLTILISGCGGAEIKLKNNTDDSLVVFTYSKDNGTFYRGLQPGAIYFEDIPPYTFVITYYFEGKINDKTSKIFTNTYVITPEQKLLTKTTYQIKIQHEGEIDTSQKTRY